MDESYKNDKKFKYLSFLFIGLNICDMFITYIAIKNGCIEQNFIINVLYNINIIYPLIFKIGISILIIFYLTICYKKLNYNISSFYLLIFLNISYILICVNNLYWIIGV